MNRQELTSYVIDRAKSLNVDKSQVVFTTSEKHELNIENKEITLMRTTFDTVVNITCIRKGCKGVSVINQTDKDSLDRAIDQAIAMADSSQPDAANDIAESSPAFEITKGPQEPDSALMYDRLNELLQYTRETYPHILFENGILDFLIVRRTLANSNGVVMSSDTGGYNLMAVFTAKDGCESSSFNYTSVEAFDLDKPLAQLGGIDDLLRQSSEQIRPRFIPSEFKGDILITPHCLQDFLYQYISCFLGDQPIITGSSIFKNRLNEQIADSKFSLGSFPMADDVVSHRLFTSEGYKAENFHYIKNGILQNFNLSLYGARKTGLKVAPNDACAMCVDPGETPYAEMIKKIKRGILLCRFSGGRPGDNGDISGVAKNSYYIEDGKILYPITETMISANLATMFAKIADISRERLYFGGYILPSIRVCDIDISGRYE